MKVTKVWSTQATGRLDNLQSLLQLARHAGVPADAYVGLQGGYGDGKPTLRVSWTEKA